MTEVDIERDPAAADYVMSVNGGNQTVPTVVFPDGSVLVNPSAAVSRVYLSDAKRGDLVNYRGLAGRKTCRSSR
jgi:hypothetical protein